MSKPWYERMKQVDEPEFWQVVANEGYEPGAVLVLHALIKLPSCRVRAKKDFKMLAGWDQKDNRSRRFEQSETVYWVVEEQS